MVKNDGLGHHLVKMYQKAPLNEVLIILFLHLAEDGGQLNHGLLRERAYLLAATIVGAVGQQAFAQHLFYYISLYLNALKRTFSHFEPAGPARPPTYDKLEARQS